MKKICLFEFKVGIFKIGVVTDNGDIKHSQELAIAKMEKFYTEYDLVKVHEGINHLDLHELTETFTKVIDIR